MPMLKHDAKDILGQNVNKIIEISSDEESDAINEQFTSSVTENIESRTNEADSVESLACENCTQIFKDLDAKRAHLLNNSACFFPLTQCFWQREPYQKQLCIICDNVLSNELMLKLHCFKSTDCRKAFTKFYIIKMKVKRKSMLESTVLSTPTIVESSTSNLSSGPKDNSVASTATAPPLTEVSSTNDTSTSAETTICLQDQNIEAPTVIDENTASQRKIENSKETSIPRTQLNNNATQKRQLRSSTHKTVSPGRKREYDSQNKDKHLDASAKRRKRIAYDSGERQSQQFSCNSCSRTFDRETSLKAHETKMHTLKLPKGREHIVDGLSNHLYCFFCEKFLKSDKDIRDHQCKPTRLLSRSWYSKAVWKEGEYQCRCCSGKYFRTQGYLWKHMYSHEQKNTE